MLPNNYQESLICIQEACKKAGLSFKYIDTGNILAEVEINDHQKFFFIHNKNPFNTFSAARVCQDKAIQADLYKQANILHPKTKSYFNPNVKKEFQKYSTHSSISQIIYDIDLNFSFPFFLKKNISSLSKDVHLVENKVNLESLLHHYFSNDTNIIVIQTKIIGQEYRVISLKGKPLLAYKKGNKFSQHNHKAEKVSPIKFEKITKQIHKALNTDFFGADVIENEKGIYLIETNANPACFYYNKHNGREDFIQVYLKCLQVYQN